MSLLSKIFNIYTYAIVLSIAGGILIFDKAAPIFKIYQLQRITNNKTVEKTVDQVLENIAAEVNTTVPKKNDVVNNKAKQVITGEHIEWIAPENTKSVIIKYKTPNGKLIYETGFSIDAKERVEIKVQTN